MALTLSLGGCEISAYVAEQAWGQLKVLRGRRRISEMLRRRDLRPDWRRKLSLVLLVRRYATEEIGLARTGAYSRFYDTGGKPVVYNLSASPKDALRPKVWRFPFVGSVPYLGFFVRQRGVQMQRRLRAKGLDTYLRPVPAYSSLGWFDDPVYSVMLAAPAWRLAEVVIHETTHTTIFLRDRIGFNESLAVFVGQQGTLNLFARLYGPLSPRVRTVQRRFARRRRFAQVIGTLRGRLSRLYARDWPLPRKLKARERQFAWARARYKQVFPDPRRWGSFVRRPLNNAVILSYGRYLVGLRFHQSVYRCLGRDLGRLVGLYKYAQQFPSPIEYVATLCKLRSPRPQRM